VRAVVWRVACSEKERFDFEKSNLQNFAESIGDMVEKMTGKDGRP
jgi:hypothetical protein